MPWIEQKSSDRARITKSVRHVRVRRRGVGQPTPKRLCSSRRPLRVTVEARLSRSWTTHFDATRLSAEPRRAPHRCAVVARSSRRMKREATAQLSGRGDVDADGFKALLAGMVRSYASCPAAPTRNHFPFREAVVEHDRRPSRHVVVASARGAQTGWRLRHEVVPGSGRDDLRASSAAATVGSSRR